MKPREKWMRVVDEHTYALIVPGGVVIRREYVGQTNADYMCSESMTYVPMPGSFADQFVTARLYLPPDYVSKPIEEPKP